jgi:hypothetical protein
MEAGQQKSLTVPGISFGPKNARAGVKRWYLKEKLKNGELADSFNLGWQSPAEKGINHRVPSAAVEALAEIPPSSGIRVRAGELFRLKRTLLNAQ